MIALIRERLAREDARARLRARRLPAHDAAGRGARRDAARDRPAARTSSSSSSSPDEVGRRAAAAPRRGGGPRRRHARGDPHAGSGSTTSETEPLVEHYRARGNLVGIHADRPVDDVFERDPAGARAGGGQVIIRKAPAEIERMARAGAVVADTLALIGERARPGVTTQELDELADEFIRSRGGIADLQGLPRLPGVDLRLAERHGRSRHPRPVHARRRRHPLRGRGRDARRLRRGLGLHVPDRRGLARGRAAARGLPGRARGRDRAVPRRQPALGHLARDPARHRGARLLGRSQPGRPRRRPLDARGAADPELRRARPRAAARRGHDVRDRADDQRRRRRRSCCTTTSGRSRPRTARCRPTSSTRSRSPTTARAS